MQRYLWPGLLLLVGLWVLPPTVAAEECLVSAIIPDDALRYNKVHESFARHFAQSGNSCRIYIQKPNSDVMSLRNSSRKAVAIGSEMIIAYGAAAARAAQAEAYSTPILFADVYDPVAQGLIPDLKTPGKKATGIRGNGPVQTLVKFFKETTGAESLLVLFQPGNPDVVQQIDVLQQVAAKRQISLVKRKINKAGDIEGQLAKVKPVPDGVFVTDSHFSAGQFESILDYAAEHHVPVISQVPGLGEQGAFMNLEADPDEQGQVLADYAARLLAGEKLADLAPVVPKQVSFTINLMAASNLDINVPFQILSVTNRVVR